MPQLVKGGKWVFGWAMVGPSGELPIPPEAWEEYGFQVGDEVAFLPGSKRSGGFGLSHPRLLIKLPAQFQDRILARGRIDEAYQVAAPAEVGVEAGDLLLVARGSGRALGFLARGPIYEEARKHSELAIFVSEAAPLQTKALPL